MAYIDWREPVRLLEETNGPATPEQHDLAILIGMALRHGEHRKIATALLADRVEPAIYGREVSPATNEQLAFLGRIAKKESSFRGVSKRVASAWIDYYLAEQAIADLRALRLQRGDRVIKTEQVTFEGESPSTFVHSHTVSSIGANGRVYFTGGNGAGGWPSQLRSESV